MNNTHCRYCLLAFSWALALGTTAAPIPVNAEQSEIEEWTDPKEVLELGNKQDKTRIPYLRQIKQGRAKHRNSPAGNAQMALAKLGEKPEMAEIVAESKSKDPEVQAEGIRKLEYIANKEAIRALIALLDSPAQYRRKEWKGPDGKIHPGDVVYAPPSHQAAQALERILPKGPKIKGVRPSKDDVKAWKEWWKVNRREYE